MELERSPYQPPADGEALAERRQLTVMFCDIANSTAFSGLLDPEAWREVLNAYYAACAAAVERYEGRVAQYLGDGVVAYFGHPFAHEDDPQRAVRAALEAAKAVPELNRRFRLPLTVSVRVAVHTGVVVVGEIGTGGRREQQALGTVPNVVARLQELAPPNTAIVSDATHRLVRGYFDMEPHGSHRLEGIGEPMDVFLVRGETAARGRLEATASEGFSPFIGRQYELEFLGDQWEQAKEGRGRVIFVNGEPGIGKSRLVRVMRERISAEPHLYVELRGSPYFRSSALHPVIDTLQRAVGFDASDNAETRLEKLAAVVPAAAAAELLPLLAALLSLPHPAGYPELTLTSEQQRQQTLKGIVAWWLGQAHQQPVLIIVEDLHWIDPSTLELLGMLMPHVATERILLIATFRPEFVAPRAQLVAATPLALNRLTRRQVSDLVTGLARGKDLPAEILEQIVARADGVPLFVEELTKLVLESELLREAGTRYVLAGALPPVGIPATLHDSLMARLDRLGAAKEVAQRAAVLGREFSYQLLRAIARQDDDTLARDLARLEDAQLLRRRGRPPEAVYRFNHSLIQEQAYDSLLRSARRAYHHAAAEALEQSFPELAETEPEVVAQHYTEAGVGDRAITFWRRAGRRATARSAYEEAIQHFGRALDVIGTLPAGAQRVPVELDVQMALATVLMVARGYASAETGTACERALELSRQVEETPPLFEALMGLWSFYMVRAEHATARQLADQCMRLAERAGVPLLQVWAHLAVGQSLQFTGDGDLTAVRAHFERAYALYDPKRHRAHRSSSTQDPGVMALATTSHLLWHLGYPDQALERARASYTIAQEIAHPHSVAYALTSLCHVLMPRGEVADGQAAAEQLIALAREEGFAYYETVGVQQLGWGRVLAGRILEGIELLEKGIASARATGGRLGVAYYLTFLAAAYERIDRIDDAWARWSDAMATVQRTGEAYYAPLLHYVKGDLLLSGGDAAEAERAYQEAIAIARRQQTKLPELNASVRLARLRRTQDRVAEAFDLLAPIYGWFTEGFGTLDLEQAKTLLDELQQVAPTHS